MQATQDPTPSCTEGAAATESGAGRTCWSVIRCAQGEGPEARAAYDTLIRRYERSVVLLIRAYGHPWRTSPEELKQSFFLKMIEREDILKLDPERGRFRDWLRVAVRRFVINQRARFNAGIRGDSITTPEQFEIMHGCTPDLFLQRSFAEQTVQHATSRVQELLRKRHPARFEQLVRFIPGPEFDVSDIGPLAKALGVPANRLSVQTKVLRHQFRRMLQDAVADTLDLDASAAGSAELIDQEIRELFRLLHDVPSARVLAENA